MYIKKKTTIEKKVVFGLNKGIEKTFIVVRN